MKFKSVMGEHGYAETDSDYCVFVKVFGEDVLSSCCCMSMIC